jgi:hypothetical protein
MTVPVASQGSSPRSKTSADSPLMPQWKMWVLVWRSQRWDSMPIGTAAAALRDAASRRGSGTKGCSSSRWATRRAGSQARRWCRRESIRRTRRWGFPRRGRRSSVAPSAGASQTHGHPVRAGPPGRPPSGNLPGVPGAGHPLERPRAIVGSGRSGRDGCRHSILARFALPPADRHAGDPRLCLYDPGGVTPHCDRRRADPGGREPVKAEGLPGGKGRGSVCPRRRTSSPSGVPAACGYCVTSSRVFNPGRGDCTINAMFPGGWTLFIIRSCASGIRSHSKSSDIAGLMAPLATARLAASA